MALPPIGDLTPKSDVKGGETTRYGVQPITPPPMGVGDYQQYVVSQNGNGVWKLVATAAVSVLFGFVVAWWTALQQKGVMQKDMQEYVREQKDMITQHMSLQDSEIGVITGKQEKDDGRISRLEFQQGTDERDFTEFKTETKKGNELVAGYLEQLKAKK